MDFNNREIAFLIWLTLLIGYSATKEKTRGDISTVLRAILQPTIVTVLAWAAIWIGLCVWSLVYIGWWDLSNLKTTLAWTVTCAFVTMFNVTRASKDSLFFRKTARDTVNVTVVITFIAELYSFSLPVELLLLPILVFVTALQVFSERDPKHAAAHKLASVVLIIAGFSYFSYSIYEAATHVESFATINNLREFLVPIFLSLLFLPFIYALSVYVGYENNLLRLRWAVGNDELRHYAARQAMMRFRFDLEGLNRWTRNVAFAQPSTREEIRGTIAEVLVQRRRERNPPHVAPEKGWSPYAATTFLAVNGLATSDYHRVGDELWTASSKMVEIDKNALFPDTLAYYIEGSEHAAEHLKLELNINDQSGAAASELRFLVACGALLQAAVGGTPPALLDQIRKGGRIDSSAQGRRVRMEKKDFINRSCNGYSRILTIDHNPHDRDPYKRGT